MPNQDDKFLFPGTPEERSKNVDEYVDNIFDSITLPSASSIPAEMVEILAEAQREIEAKKELNAKAVKIVEDLKVAEAVSDESLPEIEVIELEDAEAKSEESLPEIEILEEGVEENPLEVEGTTELTEQKLMPAEERFLLTCKTHPEICDEIYITQVQNAIKKDPREADFLMVQFEQDALTRWQKKIPPQKKKVVETIKPITSEEPRSREKLAEAIENMRREFNVISANLSKKPTPGDPPDVIRWQKGYRPEVAVAFRNFTGLILDSPNPTYTFKALSTDKIFSIIPEEEKIFVSELLIKYKIDELIAQTLKGQ